MRILVANPFGIGDVLFTLPLVREIRAQDSGGLLGYLCNRRTAEMVSCWREVNWHRVFELRAQWRLSARDGWRAFHRIVQELRDQRFDLLVDLSLGWQVGLAAQRAGIPRRVGYDYRNRGRFLNQKVPLAGFHSQPVADYYLDLLPLIGFNRPTQTGIRWEPSEELLTEAAALLQASGAAPDEKLLAVVPGGGATWGAWARFKQWPPGRFAQVADALCDRAGTLPLLLGDSEEQPLCEEVRRSMRHRAVVLAPVPSLSSLAGLLKRCALVVGNDGGTLHLATAVGAKTVSLFGPVDASIYGPYAEPRGKGNHRVVVRGLACQPCYQNFRFPPCPWDNRCLQGLSVEPVLEAAHDLLGVS